MNLQKLILLFGFITTTLLFSSYQLSELEMNTNISGVINSYAKVSAISSGPNCSEQISVSSVSGFAAGDFALIIQMQGATINETNSANFGDITNLNSAGLFEKIEIASISGTTITTTVPLVNDYQISGNVQLVSIEQYADATVTSTLSCQPWDGDTGGILAMEVSGTLTLNADIDVSSMGFRGGGRLVFSSSCSWFGDETDYYYSLANWEGEGKGEGVAAYITGKETGRGPQANGGGGGNDHNSGGGGGAGYGSGGIGGENDEPGFFNCKGFNPGLGGKVITFTDTRLFMGGGGGAGHDNNNLGTNGQIGGGIIYSTINQINPSSNIIKANGGNQNITTGLDGGGGGGGGGAIYLDITGTSSNLNIEATGGNGTNADNKNQNRCMGPGGGGGGGIIYTNLPNSSISTNINGGSAGTVINSTNGCNNSNNNATSGNDGSILSLPTLPQANIPILSFKRS